MDVNRWNQNFEEVQRYLAENNCKLEDVPKDVRASNGTVMRIWIAEMRKAYQNLTSTNFHLNDEQKEKLRSIGMDEWINQPEQEWLAHLMDVKAFYEEHHHFSVPFDMKSGNIVLYNWIVKQRSDFKKDIMSEERIQKIKEYGLMEMVAFRRTPFENGFYHAKMFYKEHHHLQVPEDFECEDGYPLRLWIDELQQKFSQNQLSATIIRKMNRIGMIWESKTPESEINAPDEKSQNAKLNKAKFKKKFCYAKTFFQKHGHLFVPENFVCEDGYELGKWIYQLRQKYAQNRLFSEWIEALNEIGMVWIEEEYQFEWGFCHANQFYQENENLFVPENYICIDGYQLGKWICEIRNQFMQGNLSEEQIQKLNNIGIIWNIRTQDFEVGYYHAELFYQENQHLFIPSIFVCGDGFRLGIWIYNQRYKFEKNQLLPEEIEKLNQIEMIWNISAYFWNLNYQDCKVYFEEHGNLDIPADFKGKSGIFLLDWIQECQKEYQKGNFSSEQPEREFFIRTD